MAGIIVEKIGLDSSKYNGVSSANVDEGDIVNFTLASCLPDKKRFNGVEKLSLRNFLESFASQRTLMLAPLIACRASVVPICCVGIQAVGERLTGGAALLG